MKNGIMVHYYVANESMNDKAFYNADGEMLIGIHVLSPLLPTHSLQYLNKVALRSRLNVAGWKCSQARSVSFHVASSCVSSFLMVLHEATFARCLTITSAFQILVQLVPMVLPILVTSNIQVFLPFFIIFHHICQLLHTRTESVITQWLPSSLVSCLSTSVIIHHSMCDICSLILSFSECHRQVVAWHGNLAPYKYDLDYFCTMNAVSFDHPVRLLH